MLRGRSGETTPEEMAREEKVRILDQWIQKGLDLIKQERLEEALDYYADEHMARKIGFGSGSGIYSMPIKTTNCTEEQLQDWVDMCTERCRINISGNPYHPITPEDVWSGILDNPDLKITVQGITYPPRPTVNFARLEPFGPQDKIPPSANQQVALAYVEVWIQALQMVNGKPLKGGVSDSRMDAQMYLMDSGIKVPGRFATRRSRESQIIHTTIKQLPDILNQQDK